MKILHGLGRRNLALFLEIGQALVVGLQFVQINDLFCTLFGKYQTVLDGLFLDGLSPDPFEIDKPGPIDEIIRYLPGNGHGSISFIPVHLGRI